MDVNVPQLDKGDAGVFWRACRLQTLEEGAAQLTEGAEPAIVAEIQSLLERIKSSTAHLDSLWEEQRSGNAQAHWWQDGELDQHRADSMNDDGLAALKSGDTFRAFQAFTEAVRLWPAAAAYHSNRASVALTLGRFADAEESAAAAVERDGASARARLRLARAQLELGRYDAAVRSYRSAAEMSEPGTSAHRNATRGLQTAMDLQRAEDARARQQQRESSLLPLGRRPPEQAAAELEAARAVVQRQPGLRVGQAACAAAYMALGRWRDAEEAAQNLPDGTEERAYLVAEAAWRGGDVGRAMAVLDAFTHVIPKEGIASTSPSLTNDTRAIKLRQFLEPILMKLDSIDKSLSPEESYDECTALLANLQHTCAGASGLIARVFVQRGKALLEMGRGNETLADADAALEVEPGNPNALALRARALGLVDRHTDAFLAWRHLAKAAPGWPGLEQETAAAAKRCSVQQAAGGRQGSGLGDAQLPGSCLPTAALAALQLDETAMLDRNVVRAAYRREAARWHPDRWVDADVAQVEQAQARFIRVQEAYEEAMACMG